MLKHILNGGPIMIPLLILSVVAIAVIIDRIRVFRLAEEDSTPLRESIIKLLEAGKVEEAIENLYLGGRDGTEAEVYLAIFERSQAFAG